MKNKDLDNFFKSKSNSFDEMPSDDLWEKIQNNLSQEPKLKPNFKKNFFTMALPIIALFSVTALILNINSNPEKIDKTILSKDSIKTEESLIILDTSTKLKTSLPILGLKTTLPTIKAAKNTTILKDIAVITKQDLKINDDKEKHLTNDTIKKKSFVEYTNVQENTSLNFGGKTIQEEKNSASFKEDNPQPIEIRAVIPQETSNFQEKIYSEDEVAIKPTFSGGLTKLYEFIIQNYRTPKDCPGGQITVTFVIEKDGSLSDIKTVKDIGFGTGEEAVRVLKECPKWIPGKHDGKIVRVQYTFPIAIKADEADNDTNVHSLAGIDVKPEFIGGITKFYEYINQNYKTPKGCPGGKIYLTFIIEKDGSLSDVKSIRDVRFGSGEEAVRVLQASPKWKPGEQNGKKVRVHYSVPITIKAAEK